MSAGALATVTSTACPRSMREPSIGRCATMLPAGALASSRSSPTTNIRPRLSISARALCAGRPSTEGTSTASRESTVR